MHRDSVAGTFLVALTLCVVCSVLVSAAAVGLRPIQQANKDLFRKRNILIAAGMYEDGTDVVETFKSIETSIIDLETGEVVPEDVIDPANFDQRIAAKDPAQSVEIDSKMDIAGIKRREKYSEVFVVKEDGDVKKVILPVYGKGLWSTLYGFIALESDLNTVAGLTFYEHKETPGLGGEVDSPKFKGQWPGKLLRDESGEIKLEVVKGAAPEGSKHQIDGLSGATITSRGVSNLVRYWLSPEGFGPFLTRLGEGA